MRYLIAGLLLEMDYGGMTVEPGNNLKQFQFSGEWQKEVLHFGSSFGEFSCDQSKMLKKDNHVYEIYCDNDQASLVYHWGNMFHAFAVYPDQFSVKYHPRMKNQPPLNEDWFFSIISFHRQLLQREAAILHSSYINVKGNAILFTGPSCIGKSTQAALWQKNANAEIINGDRAVVRCVGNNWYAYGYPCSGTSGICINKTLPLKAIVVLQKSEKNMIEKLSAAQKVQALVSATELYPWDNKEVDMAFSISEKLIHQVPIIRLSCRADYDAVKLLKDYLEDEVL